MSERGRPPSNHAAAARASTSSDDDDVVDRGTPPAPEPEANPAEVFVQPVCVGTISGVRIWIHPTLPIATACFSMYAFWRSGSLALAHSLLLHGPSLWSAVLLHELSHCWAAQLLGIRVGEVILWPLGGLTSAGRSPSMSKDIAVALAGPASHALQAALFAAIFFAANGSIGEGELQLRSDTLLLVLCYDTLVMHVLLLLANLLPSFPLDGARVLADLLVASGRRSADAAAAIVVGVAAVSLAAVGVYGIILLAYGAPGGVLLGVIAVWMAISTSDLHAMRVHGLAHCHPLFEGSPAGALRHEAERESPPAASAAPAGTHHAHSEALQPSPHGQGRAGAPRRAGGRGTRAVQLADGPETELQ